MLTPSFEIDQDEHFIILHIRVPYAKISEAEFDIGGSCFKFYCKPYFLRLTLPGEVTEDGREKATYDCDSGTMSVHVPKLNTGEHFKDLQMLTMLLGKRGHSPHIKVPLIEAVDTADGSAEAAPSDEDTLDWEMDQELPADDKEACPTLSGPVYGFANRHHGVFSKLQEEVPSIVDCSDPDHMTAHERRIARIAHEETSFDPDHYLYEGADLMDNDYIKTLLKVVPPWHNEALRWQDLCRTTAPRDVEPDQMIVPFSNGERDLMKELPNKEYLLDKATQYSLYLGLVDIMFAFAYDYRTTEGESNVESAWTICKLSSTLSWLEVFRGSVHEVVHSCVRRSLCYPLFRHWHLSLAVLQDVKNIFHLGRRKLLQCLLSVRQTLNQTEPFYVMNDLYITDYCIWIQKASPKKIQSLAVELDEVTLDISSLSWDLAELEVAARLVVEEEEELRGTSEGHQDASDNNPRRASDGDLEEAPLGDNVPSLVGLANQTEEGLETELARRLTLQPPQANCLIEEISTSHSESTSSESSGSSEEEETEDSSDEGSDSSVQSPPSCDQHVESGKGEDLNIGMSPSTEQH